VLRVLTPAPIQGVGVGVGVVVFCGGFGPNMPMPMLTPMEPLSWFTGVLCRDVIVIRYVTLRSIFSIIPHCLVSCPSLSLVR
jgi:hypothetical protein